MSSPPHVDDRTRSPARRARLARALWGSVVVAVLVAGTAITLAVVDRAAASARAEEQRAFGDAASDVASRLRLQIQHQDDLVISAAAYAAREPDIPTVDLIEWLESVRARERYPDLLGLGFMRVVTPDELSDYLRLISGDPALDIPAPPPGAAATDLIVPPGVRDRYCLVQAVGYLGGDPVNLPPIYDVCTDPAVAHVVEGLDTTGVAHYVAGLEVDGTTPLLIVAPSLARAPGDTADGVSRREAVGSIPTGRLLGAVAAQVDLGTLLARSLERHPGLSAVLRHEGADTEAAVTAEHPSDEYADELDVLPGWTLMVEGSVIDAEGIDAQTLAAPVAGVIAALMTAVLVYTLGTGRDRAMELVDEATTELRHQALHDALTGLPNRLLIADRAEVLLARARREDTLPAAMFVDLDGFKDVNDSLGHDAGDLLLRAVSERLTGALRSVDTIGRLGGDEFVVLVDGATSPASAELVAERLLDAMRDPFHIGDDPVAVRVTASVGIAIGDRPTAADLLRDADVALYEAKTAGRDCWRTYSSVHDSSVRRRNEIEFELRKLVPDEALRLVYQPIFDRDHLTVVDVEALLRWHHSTRGEISPGEFIPLLERSGRIGEIGAWVLEHACAQLAEWRREGIDVGMAVNVSARQLDDDHFVDRVADIVARTGIPPALLTLEVTETALMGDPDRATDVLHALKGLGVRVAIDDFGTGYSSLAYLQRFPVDTLKIDRMFVDALDGSTEATALVRTLVKLGHELGLRTLAEGVETAEQMDQLREHAIDEVQGFLLARPMTADAVREQVLRTHPLDAEPVP